MRAVPVIVFALATAVNLAPQSIVGASIGPWDHAQASFFATNGEDPANPKLTAFVVAAEDAVSRVIWDAKRGVYTGYDIAVKPDPRNGTAQVWIQPLSLTTEAIAERLGPRWNPHWTRLKLPSYYSLPAVKFDSPILVTLWSDASSKTVDHVVVREKR
jgi:hypothetical protein